MNHLRPTTNAYKLAEKSGDSEKTAEFKGRLDELKKSRLVRADTLCHQNMTETEKRRILQNCSAEAAHWNITSDLSIDHLQYVE